MSSKSLKTGCGLELTIQTPAFGGNQKQLEFSNEPLIAHNIRTSLPHSNDFPMSQICYQSGSQEKKEQPISMIGHDHAPRQGVNVWEPYLDRAKHTKFMGHDHMARIKMHMAEGSLGDRKCCQEPGCNEVVDGRVVYCKIHSVEMSRQQLSHLQSGHESSGLQLPPVKDNQCNETISRTVTCTDQEAQLKYEGGDRCKDSSGNTQGETAQYIFPGAGMPCKHENCSKQAQENTVYCKLHSGVSKGCAVRGCTRGAHGGTPLCIGHGGGKRCVVPGCPNAACGQGRSDSCVRHGGGKRCKFDGCAKGAQGNTDYCIRHGGGRRCKFEACTKSAQGRTDFCIKHGGGSRCKFQGCGTSAKWGTDFCSVHRKSLLTGDSSAIPEALPASSAKRRRVKKPKKEIKPSELSQENVTTAAIAGSSTQQMGVLRIATVVPNHEMLTKGVIVIPNHGMLNKGVTVVSNHHIWSKGVTMVPNHTTLTKGVAMTGQAAAPPQIVAPLSMKTPTPPLSMKTPTPSGSVVTAETEAGASRAMLGL